MSERNPELYGNDELCRKLLSETVTWAVVGLGDDPSKAAYRVADFLQKQGKKILPIYPRQQVVLGERTYQSLAEAAAEHSIEVVDCFVNSSRVGKVSDEAIAVGAKAVWMQLEITDEEAAARAVDAGLAVVMDRCPAIEWPRLLPADN